MAKAMKAAEEALKLPDTVVIDDNEDGLEAADRESYAIPFLVVLQKGSPQADPDQDEFIEGAKAGMLLDSVSNLLIDTMSENVQIIPAFFRRAFVEWKSRDNGGGFVQEHDIVEGGKLLQQCERDDKNRDILPNGNQLVDTRYHYVILVREDGTMAPMVMTLSSTQVKYSKKLMSDLRLLKDSGQIRHSAQVLYKVTTLAESNEHGTWRSWKFNRAGFVNDQKQLENAIKFYQAIKSGEVREATETIDPSGTAAAANPGGDEDPNF